jgi:RNA polymerase sigma factor (sigma-70 family)
MDKDYDFSKYDNKFIKDNIRLVHYALKGLGKIKEYDDVVQEACIWLLMAKSTHDPKKSKWVTYASKYIKWMYGNYINASRIQRKSANAMGYTICSLESYLENNDITLDEEFDETIDNKIINNTLYKMIEKPRSKKIIKMLLNGYSQKYIAKKFKISHTRVGQIYNREVEKIKQKVGIMKLEKVYISGPMKGKIDLNKLAFKNAELYLKALGYIPINPHNLTKNLSLHNPVTIEEIHQCMKIDLIELLKCDAIHMLDGWQKSSNATLEYNIAKAIGLKIV